jgi:hypothetical protein
MGFWNLLTSSLPLLPAPRSDRLIDICLVYEEICGHCIFEYALTMRNALRKHPSVNWLNAPRSRERKVHDRARVLRVSSIDLLHINSRARIRVRLNGWSEPLNRFYWLSASLSARSAPMIDILGVQINFLRGDKEKRISIPVYRMEMC